MKHQESNRVPDSTYFRTGDAEPTIEPDGSITLLNGHGSRRSSWGAPQVNTTVLIDEPDFLTVVVGFSHKHGGGQFYRYYTPAGQTDWAHLSDERQTAVLAAYESKAPSWARKPGKPRAERKSPEHTHFTAYKVMRVAAGGFLSLYNDFGWQLGRRNADGVRENHAGGLYIHKDSERIVNLFDAGELGKVRPGWQHVLVECDCYGKTVEYDNGKIAVTYVTPLRVIREL